MVMNLLMNAKYKLLMNAAVLAAIGAFLKLSGHSSSTYVLLSSIAVMLLGVTGVVLSLKQKREA